MPVLERGHEARGYVIAATFPSKTKDGARRPRDRRNRSNDPRVRFLFFR
jgi:hypothetical protein